jgi:hypothetical protein
MNILLVIGFKRKEDCQIRGNLQRDEETQDLEPSRKQVLKFSGKSVIADENRCSRGPPWRRMGREIHIDQMRFPAHQRL